MNEMTNTHIIINRFAYLEPETLQEAFALLKEYGKRAKLLAGGTDLFVHMKMERSAPDAVINIQKIAQLKQINVEGNQLRVGACATIKAVEENPNVKANYMALVESAASFSTTQIQTMGTIGGNLGNGSPASDSAPALIAFGADIQLASGTGTRTLPLANFFTGPGKTVLQPDELITAVLLPLPAENTGSAFLKISRVAADIAKASVAAVITLDPHDHHLVQDCRLAYGSVAPVPMRALAAEAQLRGREIDEDLILQVAEAAAQEVTPISDVRSTAQYRRDVVKAITIDALTHAWRRARFAEAPAWTAEPPAVEDPQPAEKHVAQLPAGEKRMIELTVNGHKHQVWVSSHELLLNVLREQLQLTGTKYGCGIGECSACTILFNGKPALACLILAVSAVGQDIQTVEGLESADGELDPLQEAFIEYSAYQCGYCTPGMLMTSKSLLAEIPQPTEDDIRHYLRGNLCRCTGYANIVRAVLSCAK